MTKVNNPGCPNSAEHAACPDSYLAWHEWAERKSKTHDQFQCPGCGFWVIWLPKLKKEEAK